MRLNHGPRAVAPLLSLVLGVALVACSSSNGSPSAGASTGGNGASQGAAASQGGNGGNGGASAQPSSGGNGNGGASAQPSSGGNGGPDDAVAVGEQLVPPNSTETSRTIMGNYWYVMYESTDSPDSLKSFYESKVPAVGLMIISTTSSAGSHSMLIARDETGDFGGSVLMSPSASGSGSMVIVAVGSSN